MGSLKLLSLKDKKFNEVLNGCSLLEDLSLIECYGLRKLNFTASSIKNLALVLGSDERWKLNISCPNLMSFDVSSHVEHAYLTNVLSLVNAAINFSHKLSFFSNDCSDFKALLEKLRHCKVITLGDQCVLV
ncbi:hypothetical protein L1049_025113 [Liquidambar formosana]|uniref:F-box/LRR-repeat protein n=1 Tax=Liquidambar formosana TaxID=63359 RepID=A0AAP0RWA0_LIQFO